MSKQATYLLVGGPRDGLRMEIGDPYPVLRVPLPTVERFDFFKLSDLDPVGPTPRHTTYHAERLRGQDFEAFFYRHEDITIDQALDMLLTRYRSQP